MKSTIAKCLQDMLIQHEGLDVWKRVVVLGGLDEWTLFLSAGNVADATVVALFEAAGDVLDRPVQQVMDDFGIFWSTSYAPHLYDFFFEQYRDSWSFVLGLAEIHQTVTRSIPRATPPDFDYEIVKQGEHVRMTYKSERGLVGLMPGLLRGLGLYYGRAIDVARAGNVLDVRFGPTVPEVRPGPPTGAWLA